MGFLDGIFGKRAEENSLEGENSISEKEREDAKFDILTKLEAAASEGMDHVADDDRVASETKELMDGWREKMGDEEYEKFVEEIWSGFSLKHGPEVVKRTRNRVENAQAPEDNEEMPAAA